MEKCSVWRNITASFQFQPSSGFSKLSIEGGGNMYDDLQKKMLKMFCPLFRCQIFYQRGRRRQSVVPCAPRCCPALSAAPSSYWSNVGHPRSDWAHKHTWKSTRQGSGWWGSEDKYELQHQYWVFESSSQPYCRTRYCPKLRHCFLSHSCSFEWSSCATMGKQPRGNMRPMKLFSPVSHKIAVFHQFSVF